MVSNSPQDGTEFSFLAFIDALVFAKTGSHLGEAQRALLSASWLGERRNYDQIADACGYSAHYLRKHVGPDLWQMLSNVLGEKVTKINCRIVIERQMALSPRPLNPPSLGDFTNSSFPQIWGARGANPPPIAPYYDWGEASDVEVFYGRQTELDLLLKWIAARCRLIGVFGVGGIGKTHLSIKLAQQVTDFDCVIWRSLRNAPPLTELLADLLQTITRSPQLTLPDATEVRLTLLLEHLRSMRCLLVLDNAETLLKGGECSGQYREGYEDYGQFFKRMGETNHLSCLLLTSREKPKEFGVMEGETLPVRSLHLKGLSPEDAQQIIDAKGIQIGSETVSNELVYRYGGNPLALKIVTTTIQELFDGDVSQFLQENTAVTSEINELLDQHFARLSAIEKTALYGLAVAREPLSLTTLCSDWIAPPPRHQILDALKSLGQRSLIEKHDGLFSLQPVVMEYVGDRLITAIAHEIIQNRESFELLNQHILLKAEAKDYIREIQNRLILTPLLEQLLKHFKVKQNLEKHLESILNWQRNNFPLEPGYLAGNILNLLLQLGTDLSGYDCSHLTIWQAYLEGANLNYVNFAYSDLSRSVLTETFASTLSVAFSPDGHYFATATTDNDICLWQTKDGKKVRVYQGHRGWVHSVAFSPTDSIIATGSEDETIRLWDMQTGQCLKTLKGHQNWVWAVAFSADGRWLASSSNDQTVRLWDVQTGVCLRVLEGHQNWVWSVAFSPDQTLLASGSNDKTIKIWDVQTGECVRTLLGHTDWVQSVAFSPITSLLASGSRDQTIKLWDVQTGACAVTLQGHTNWVQSVTFDGTGTLLASASNDQTAKLWDLTTHTCLRTFQSPIQDIWSVAFSPDGKALILGGSDQTVQMWDVQTGQCLKTLRGHISGILSLDSSADGRYLVTGGSDRTVRLWDLKLGQCIKTLNGHTSWVRSVAFSPQNHMIASGSSDHTIRLWDSVTGECLKILQGHDSWVRSVRFNRDGKLLVSGSTDHTIRLWDVQTGECLHRLDGHDSWVRCVAFSPQPSQTIIASSSDDQTIRLWDSHSGECLRVLAGHTSGIWAVAFSPDGSLIGSGGDDRVVKIWDVQTGECLKTLHGHENWIQAIAFSPDGTCIASGSNDQTIQLWDTVTGERLQVLQSHHNRIWAVVFSVPPDGRSDLNSVLISGSEDETIRIWNPSTGDCLQSLRSPRPCEGMNILDIKGLTNAQKFALKALGAIELRIEPREISLQQH
ncbi:WD40 repeat domain-containing protein [Oscillatoria sp. FACHB-1407]|uniref:WD40 repeat domain-containing protein n=1 Tax=Oscillatoria sp. FACHB-1407 TaxID=2692847 RepID=UPI00168918C0|nr:WD40 repeat domain-containing protein [Oscillatoria sp. FACHB-1407]MBD2465580.1 WD40 repeat domain-containing protein [Oscillatoria sp. FACHB-1407]